MKKKNLIGLLALLAFIKAKANILLSWFAVLIVLFMGWIFISLVVKVSKLQPRQLDDDTNEPVNLHVTWPGSVPILPLPDTAPGDPAPPRPTPFHGVVKFPQAPGMSNKWVAIARTPDWQAWTFLQDVDFISSAEVSNMVELEFRDNNPLTNAGFYRGILLE